MVVTSDQTQECDCFVCSDLAPTELPTGNYLVNILSNYQHVPIDESALAAAPYLE
jgi:hypothetical protein